MIREEIPVLQVVAALLFNADAKVLIAARPPGKAFAGRWEFPGGKVDAGEKGPDALVRELAEELGIQVKPADCQRFHVVTYRYSGAARAVRIEAYRIATYAGIPTGREGQALAWHSVESLPHIDILEADRPIITALRLGPVVDIGDRRPDQKTYRRVTEIHPAMERHHMVGACVHDREEILAAHASGADYLVLKRPPNDSALECLQASGLPWYTRENEPHQLANGYWRGVY